MCISKLSDVTTKEEKRQDRMLNTSHIEMYVTSSLNDRFERE